MTAYERALTLREARRIWAEREKGFPRFVQQTWEQGTLLAHEATIIMAAQELGFLPTDPQAGRA